MPEPVLTPKQVAEFFGVHPRTARRLPLNWVPASLGGRKVVVRQRDLDAYCDSFKPQRLRRVG